jgi:fibronectin type 3 domain-containing protein
VHGPDQQVEGADSTPLHIFTRDIFAPAVPTGLQAVFSGVGQQPFVDLTWAPDLDADLAGYNVYRWEQGGTPVRLNAQLVPSPSFRDTNVAAGRTYYYSVSAVDLRGNESARSEQTAEQIP